MKRTFLLAIVLSVSYFGLHAQTWSGSSLDGDTYRNGNVGIGTTSPSAKLDIKEEGGASGNNSALRLRAGNASTYGGNSQILLSYDGGKNYSHAIKTRHQSGGIDNNSIDFYVWQPVDLANETGTLHTMSLNGGKVGIKTMYPNYELDVNGTIHTKEVKVDMNGWSDFVFHFDYNLRPLQELNTYIQQNGHLPEIPTAKEVEENGISLGEMNAKLLQKIEELTLYTIEQQKEIEELKKQNERIDKLETIIKNQKR